MEGAEWVLPVPSLTAGMLPGVLSNVRIIPARVEADFKPLFHPLSSNASSYRRKVESRNCRGLVGLGKGRIQSQEGHRCAISTGLILMPAPGMLIIAKAGVTRSTMTVGLQPKKVAGSSFPWEEMEVFYNRSRKCAGKAGWHTKPCPYSMPRRTS